MPHAARCIFEPLLRSWGAVELDLQKLSVFSISSREQWLSQDKCKACEKTVYVVDLLSADGVPFHKACFKCSHCKSTLKTRASRMFSGTVYKCATCCKTAYPLEKVTVVNESYHKHMLQMLTWRGCALSPSNYAVLQGYLVL